MTKTQAQNVSAAITNAGFGVRMLPFPDGTWQVTAVGNLSNPIPVSQANSLAVSQGVSATVIEVVYS
jgi:hypothetical protein